MKALTCLIASLSFGASATTSDDQALHELRGLAHRTIERQATFGSEPLLAHNARAFAELHQQTQNVLLLTDSDAPTFERLSMALQLLEAPFESPSGRDSLPAAEQFLLRTLIFTYLLGQHSVDSTLVEGDKTAFEHVTATIHGVMVGVVQHRGTVPAVRERFRVTFDHALGVMQDAQTSLTNGHLKARLSLARAAVIEALHASDWIGEYQAMVRAYRATDLGQDCATALTEVTKASSSTPR